MPPVFSPEPGKKPPQAGEDTAQHRSGKGSCRIDEYVPEVAVPSGHRELMPFIGEGKAAASITASRAETAGENFRRSRA